MVGSEPRDNEVAQRIDRLDGVLAAFRPGFRRPSWLLLAVGVPLTIGLAVGAASSSLLIGAGAFVVAALAPIYSLFRLTMHDG